MEHIIYTKYSNDRAKEFSIRTDIILHQDGTKFVVKKALDENAQKHIKAIGEAFDFLYKNYEGSQITVNKCKIVDTRAFFEYLEGETLEAYLDSCLEKDDIQALLLCLDKYINIIKGKNDIYEFKITPEFTEIFGSVKLPLDLKANKVCNIDMILSNVILGERWNLIDYEWTFPFMIPTNYIIYRVLNYYLFGASHREKLHKYDLFNKYGIRESEITEYERMEKSFQKYVLSGSVPLRTLYKDFGKKMIHFKTVFDDKEREEQKKLIWIYFNRGNGFNAADSISLSPDINCKGHVQFELSVEQDVSQIRIDPMSGPCAVQLYQMSLNGEGQVEEFVSNGQSWPDGLILFDTEDPQIILDRGKEKKVIRLKVEFALSEITQEVIRSMTQKWEQNKPLRIKVLERYRKAFHK